MEELMIVSILKWLGVTVAGDVVCKGSEKILKKIREEFSKKFINDFETKEKSEEFINEIYKLKSNSPNKPKRDIEDVFESITGNEPSDEIMLKIVEWIKENQQILNKVLKKEEIFMGIKIGSQKANRDIINVQGDLTINNK